MNEALTVALGDRAYPIHFTDSKAALRQCVAELKEAKREIRVLTDANLHKCQSDYLQAVGFAKEEILSLPAGEPTKSIESYAETLRCLAHENLNRDSALFAFGGGVIGDLAGFVAASYLRGIDFYQIPTSLLAMVDSSVGGKTGINLPEGKNLVGAFWQPKAVFIDTGLLQSLPTREFAAGMAEIVKYGLLADRTLFEELESLGAPNPESKALPAIIRRCCEIKAHIVVNDETETAASGGRALLNLGHTFAHAIENAAGYGDYLHGEAVAIGLVLATQLSVNLGQLEVAWTDRVIELLQANALPVRLKSALTISDLVTAMQRDKKNRSGNLRFVTLKAAGEAITTDGVETALIEALWQGVGAA
ncbi:MAG: 3-dehydroquinate synthase [Verrucomicrobia bacterium]|nr:3-dehydroquinate synthase [Verrucomicrobiota bacterium]